MRTWLFFLLPLSLFAGTSTSFNLATKSIQQLSMKNKGPLLVLDPGHGGKDEGTKVKQLQEKKINLLTALYAKKYLEDLGYRVILTRKKDTHVPLAKRVSIAQHTHAMLFVSIHCNSAPNSSAQGIEVFYHRGKNPDRNVNSSHLANRAIDAIITETHCASRGVKEGRFYVIRETSMPAILIEIGFLTNTTEWGNMRKKSYLEKVAKGISQGIDQYMREQKHALGAI